VKNEPVAAHALAQTARFLDWSGRLAGVGVFEWVPAYGHLTVSESAGRLLGLPAAHIITMHDMMACFDEDGRAMLDAALQRTAKTQEGWDTELLTVDGRTMRVMGGCEDEGPHLRVLVALQDISERVRARADLENALASLELATHSGRIGVWQLDLRTDMLSWDATMWRLYGEEPGNLATMHRSFWLKRIHPDDRDLAEAALQAAIDGLRPLDIAFRIRTRDGELRHVRSAARVMRDAHGQALRLSGVNWDETPLRREADELHYRATHDGLTGLVNRAEFSQRLQRALGRRGAHALLVLDLDHFKAVNDRHGHAAGDAVLRQISHLLRHTVRARDTVARLGGDEFAALLENATLEEAMQVADKLCKAMWQERFIHCGHELQVGVSIGVAVTWPGAGEEALMLAADAACLAAKAGGRNQARASPMR